MTTESTVERKTVTPGASLTVTSKRIVTEQKNLPPFVKENVLNKYRSYTYNFTLAALSREQVANPDTYRSKGYNFDFVVLKSGGKGTSGFNKEAVSGVKVTKSFRAEGDSRAYQTTEVDKEIGKELVDDFNARGVGKFDMYIDNVEIETLMSFTPNTNTSFATKINFEVFEPYSINGFPQALHVAAVSSGYASYIGASFVLMMEFLGYPDDKDIPNPEAIEYTKRYFVIKFNNFEADVSERGTKYTCQCIPFQDTAFGNANILKDPIQLAGNTVGEILQNFEDSVNNQIKSTDKDYKPSENATRFDKYEIKFGELVDGKLNYEKNKNLFSDSKVVELLKDKSLYRFPDPGNATAVDSSGQRRATQAQVRAADNQTAATDPRYTRYTPEKVAVQFPEKSRIHECIIAILRDCEYTRSILDKLDDLLDDDDMVTYFAILTEVEVGEIDAVTKRNYQTFRYIIVPYKLHFTRIPGFQSEKYDTKILQKKAIRTYNYIYSGTNPDLIGFKLNFNTLFFEAVPKALGVTDYRFSDGQLAPDNENDPRLSADNVRNIQRDQVGTPQINVNPNFQQLPNIGVAGPVSVKPLDVLTRNMHEAIVNSKASLLTGDLEILGDPVYLTTLGQGNYKPTYIPGDTILSVDGEVIYHFKEVFINIVFKNPVDIGENGLYQFDKNQVPFGGVYRVNTVKSSFKDGVFRQTLSVLRMPGQFVNPGQVQPTEMQKLQFEPNPYDQLVTAQVSTAGKSAARTQGINIIQQITSAATAVFNTNVASPLAAFLNRNRP